MSNHPLKSRFVLLLGATCFLALFSHSVLAEDGGALLNKAASQIRAGDYAAAKETLAKVKPSQLTPAERDTLSHLSAKAGYAMNKATTARQNIASAEELAKQNKFVAAQQLLESTERH